MKRLILLPLLCVCASAYAVPNIWSFGEEKGYSVYSIEDVKERKLSIHCNTGAGDNADHGAIFENGNKNYENSNSKYPLTFLIDDYKVLAPPGTTKWSNGSTAWNEFIDNMSKAKKIDVYLNNKKITTFMPTKLSVSAVSKKMAKCRSLY